MALSFCLLAEAFLIGNSKAFQSLFLNPYRGFSGQYADGCSANTSPATPPHHPFSDLALAAGTVRFVLTTSRDMARDMLGIMPDTPNKR